MHCRHLATIIVCWAALANATWAAPGGEFRFAPLRPTAAATGSRTTEWRRAALPPSVDRAALEALAATYFTSSPTSGPGRTLALVLAQHGAIVYERYAKDIVCTQVLHTMSVAKMMGAVMAGLLVADGKLKLDAPVSFPEWPPGDPRRAITARNLLTMTSGLRWRDPADFLEFAFGDASRDLAHYVASQPLEFSPGTHFAYSDGTPSLIGALLKREVGGRRQDVARFMRDRLFTPLGMTRTQLEFDLQGTWYGSSGVRWSPCDLARFGEFLLRDGTWAGARYLPEGWVNFMRTPSGASLTQALPPGMSEEERLPYGAFTFVFDLTPAAITARARTPLTIDAFGHEGFGGSLLRVVPSHEAVLVIVAEGVHEDAQRSAIAKQLTDSLMLEPISSVP